MRENEGVTEPSGSPEPTTERMSEPTTERATVQVRRAPKTSLFPADPQVGFAALLGYFSLYGVTAGVLVGAIIGIVLDRRSQKRVRTLEAERQVVDAAPEGLTTPEGELED